MNVEIRTKAAQFPEKLYLNEISLAVCDEGKSGLCGLDKEQVFTSNPRQSWLQPDFTLTI